MVRTKTLVVILVLLLCALTLVQGIKYLPKFAARAGAHPEAATIARGTYNFNDLLARFSELADRKGAPYAFDVLREAQLPYGSDVHLLSHGIGHVLFGQQGLDGISVCTQEFGNGCSHALVIDALQEFGDGSATRARIDEACKKTGALSGYTMCYHGLGHGVFAFYGYDLQKTVSFCEKLGTAEYNRVQSSECVGGAIMELVGGGGHDRDQWQQANEKYFSKRDPLAPCDSVIIPKDMKPQCYVYMSPHFMAHFGANMEVYSEQQLTDGMAVCAALPFGPDRSGCIGGFGKDFAGIISGHDLRLKDSGGYSDAHLREVDRLCRHAPHYNDVLACESYALSNFFWGGAADQSTSVRFCALLPDDGSRDFCFENLAASIAKNIPDATQRAVRCNDLGDEYQKTCRAGA